MWPSVRGWVSCLSSLIRRSFASVTAVHSAHLAPNCYSFLKSIFALILMVSRISFMKRLVRELLDQLLDMPSMSPQRPDTTNSERTLWPRYIGSFLGARAGLALISVEDNKLVLELNNQRLSLQEHSENVYFGYLPDSRSEIAVGFISEAMKPVRYIAIDEKLCERFDRDPFFSPKSALVGTFHRYIHSHIRTIS